MSEAQFYSVRFSLPSEGGNRSIECVSVADLDSLTPVGFDEFLPEDIAFDEFRAVAAGVARQVLKLQEGHFADSREISNIDKVAAFIGRLGLKPIGKISLVDSLEILGKRVTSPGVTSHLHKQSFVIGQNIKYGDMDDDPATAELHEVSPLLPRLTRSQFIESVAVHELVHLSGTTDVLYFVADKDSHYNVLNVKSAPSKLYDRFDESKGGAYEEGFATLCGYMYLWEQFPEILSNNQTELRKAPNGYSVNLPARHTYYDNPYAYLAWGMERLTDYSPKIFDIFVLSRDRNASSTEIRTLLKGEIDKINDELFDTIDTTNVYDLNNCLSTAFFIDYLVSQAQEEEAHE